MKLICTTENLRTAILATERFTGRHVTLPILTHLLCRADEKNILLLATNLEVGIEYRLIGKVQKPGIVTIPAKPLTQLLQSLPDETITLEARSPQLTLSTPTTTITLIGLNPADFPTLPNIKPEYTFTIPATLLTTGLQQVLPAAATSELKPELAGVLFAANSNALTLAATDSFRLAEKTINEGGQARASGECIVPYRTAQELLRALAAKGNGDVRVSVGEHQVVFAWDDARILSRLIDGTYPPYQNIIPKTYETTLVVSRDDLLKKIRLASVFSSRLNDVTLRFSPTTITVETTSAETGSSAAHLAAKGRGASGSAVFNHRYLSDGLEAADSENIMLSLNGAAGPTLISNPTDTSFRYLVMPIRSV